MALLAGAYLAVVDSEFDLAVLDLDGGALDNSFEYRVQCGVREGLLHGAADLLVGDLPDIKGLEFDRVGRPALDVLIDLHRLPPAAILAAQPERDAVTSLAGNLFRHEFRNALDDRVGGQVAGPQGNRLSHPLDVTERRVVEHKYAYRG